MCVRSLAGAGRTACVLFNNTSTKLSNNSAGILLHVVQTCSCVKRHARSHTHTHTDRMHAHALYLFTCARTSHSTARSRMRAHTRTTHQKHSPMTVMMAGTSRISRPHSEHTAVIRLYARGSMLCRHTDAAQKCTETSVLDECAPNPIGRSMISRTHAVYAGPVGHVTSQR